MAKLKKKKGLKDVTGDGKFTYADVLRMRGVKPKKSMGVGGISDPKKEVQSEESKYYERLRRLDPKGEFRPDRLDLAMAQRFRMPNTGRDASNDPIDRGEPGQMAMSIGTILEQLQDPSSDFYQYADKVQTEQAIRSKYPKDPKDRTAKDQAELERELSEAGIAFGYGGKVKLKSQDKGGVVEYGLGGAVMGGINALMAGKGLAGAAGAAARGMATPGSGFAQGAQLAGNLAKKSNNPMLQNIGKMAGMASNFLPGGNPMGALGAIGGLFKQNKGGYVSKHRLLRG